MVKKLLQGLVAAGLFSLGLLGLSEEQLAHAATCAAPQVSWYQSTSCGGKVVSTGFNNNTGGLMLCVDKAGTISYGDAFGYSSSGQRIVTCNPVWNGGNNPHICDTGGCNLSVTHDAFAAW